jgi:microcystin-dependent protein
MEIIIYLIIFIQSILIIYLIYKTRKSENFSSPAIKADIIAEVNNKYKIDMDAMRNLADISRDILTRDDTLTIPATTTSTKQLSVTGDLEVRGNVKFLGKNTNIMEIFPKFMVIAWAPETLMSTSVHSIPNGWALCDGKKYSLNVQGVAYEVVNGGTLTPNLKNRFILGAGDGKVYKQTGGEERHTLTVAETPTHSHHQYANRTWGNRVPLSDVNYPAVGTQTGDNGSYNIHAAAEDNGSAISPNVGLTSFIGNGGSHENMPPFYVLYYIMKL